MAERAADGRRVTINDIAKRAGVSKGAVSYALNGRPGLSDEHTGPHPPDRGRARLAPESAPRALCRRRARARVGSFSPGRRARSPSRPSSPSSSPASSPSCRARSIALTLQLATDLESEVARLPPLVGGTAGRRGARARPAVDDPRLEALASIGLPAVVVGGPPKNGVLPAVWHDEQAAVVELVRYLAALGHTRVARVAGVPAFVHSTARTDAFEEVTRELGVSARVVVDGLHARERCARHPAAAVRARSRPRRSPTTATSSP